MVRIDDDRESAVVTRMIKEFANEASKYLMPRITFVGKDSKLAEDLQENLSWLTLSTEFKTNDSEIYILKNIPENFLEIESSVPENTGIIVVVDTNRPYPDEVRRALQRRIAVTLHNPEIENLLWTIRAVLLLKEAAYAVGTGAKLFSVDVEFRKKMSQCITSIVRGENFVISCEGAVELGQVKNFLFAPMPYAIKPRELARIEDITNKRNNNKYMTITCTGEEILRMFEFILKDRSDAVHSKKLIIFHNGSSKKVGPTGGLKVYGISTLKERKADRCLEVLMNSMESSHETLGLRITTDESDSSEQDNTIVANELDSILKHYRRMSLDSIITEAESAVLIELKRKAGSVKAVSAAAGISPATYYKKISRYKKAKTVLGIGRNK